MGSQSDSQSLSCGSSGASHGSVQSIKQVIDSDEDIGYDVAEELSCAEFNDTLYNETKFEVEKLDVPTTDRLSKQQTDS